MEEVRDHFTDTFTYEEIELNREIPTQVSTEIIHELEREVSNDEIRVATIQLGGSRALGPDGFAGLFYQRK